MSPEKQPWPRTQIRHYKNNPIEDQDVPEVLFHLPGPNYKGASCGWQAEPGSRVSVQHVQDVVSPELDEYQGVRIKVSSLVELSTLYADPETELNQPTRPQPVNVKVTSDASLYP